MFTDLTLEVTPKMRSDAAGRDRMIGNGHIGTHFDVMDREFPLEYARRRGMIFDVSSVNERDIACEDIDLREVKEGMFIGFYSGFAETAGYGTEEYHHRHPQLSLALIGELLRRKIALIGIDFAGIRRGKEHTPVDQHCADHGVFVVENLCHLNEVIGSCTVYTFPVRFSGLSGLPCRVMAER